MKIFIGIIAAFFVLFPMACLAQDSSYFTKVGVEGGHLNGGSSFHISFDDTWANGGHGESKLEFPLDNFMAGVRVQFGTIKDNVPNRVKSRVSLVLLKALKGDAGIMKDSDWIENDAAYGEAMHAGRDLYTESDDNLTDGTIFDGNYSYNFYIKKNLAVAPMVGYTYYQFKHDAIGCEGIYWTTPVACLDVKGIDYKVEFQIPYVGISIDSIFGKNDGALLNLTFALSDWARAHDKDMHLYPDWDAANAPDNLDRLSAGGASGEAIMVKLRTDITITPQLLLSLGGQWTDIRAEGSMKQEWYLNGTLIGVNLIPIEDKIEASFWSGFAGISYLFY